MGIAGGEPGVRARRRTPSRRTSTSPSALTLRRVSSRVLLPARDHDRNRPARANRGDVLAAPPCELTDQARGRMRCYANAGLEDVLKGPYALCIVATSQSSAPSIGIDFNPGWVRVSLTPVGRARTLVLFRWSHRSQGSGLTARDRLRRAGSLALRHGWETSACRTTAEADVLHDTPPMPRSSGSAVLP